MKKKEKKENKEKGLSKSEIIDIAGSFPDWAREWWLERVDKNSDDALERQKLILKADIEIANREKFKDVEIAKAAKDSEEHWKNEPESRRQEAHEKAVGDIQINKDRIDFIKNYGPLIVTGAAAGFFAAKHGMKVVFHEIERLIGIPELAQETSLLTWKQRIAKSLGLYKEEVLKSEDVIFNPEFKARMDDLTKSLREAVKYNSPLRNLLFYGIPGTGKTLIAKTIAKNSGMDYIYFAASDLLKLNQRDALNKLTDLVVYAKNSGKKLMIIIDEAEELFADRRDGQSAELKNILNLLLSRTGTESQYYFIVALTNIPDKLDPAVISRMAEKIEFPVPNEQELKRILALYIKKLLLAPIIIKPTWFEGFLGKKAKSNRIIVEPNALNNQALDNIVKKLHGFVGRDINQLVISLQAEAFAKNLRLTKKMIDEVVDRKIKEKKQADLKFQQSNVVA